MVAAVGCGGTADFSPGSLNDGKKAASRPSEANRLFIHSPLTLATRRLGTGEGPKSSAAQWAGSTELSPLSGSTDRHLPEVEPGAGR